MHSIKKATDTLPPFFMLLFIAYFYLTYSPHIFFSSHPFFHLHYSFFSTILEGEQLCGHCVICMLGYLEVKLHLLCVRLKISVVAVAPTERYDLCCISVLSMEAMPCDRRILIVSKKSISTIAFPCSRLALLLLWGFMRTADFLCRANCFTVVKQHLISLCL